MTDGAAPKLQLDYGRFAVLDGLRGIGALIVVVGHGAEGIFFSAFSAVDFFFLHSGFILAYTAAIHVDKPDFARQFIIRRMVRIYPIYLIGVLLGAAVVLLRLIGGDPAWTWHMWGVSSLLSLGLLPYFGANDYGVYPTNFVVWSLFFEVAINIAVAFTRFRVRPALATYLFSLPLLLLSYHYWPDGGGSTRADFLGGFARIGYSFSAGVLIYHLYRRGVMLPFSLPGWLCWLLFPLLYMPNFWPSNAYVALLTIVIQPLLSLLFLSSVASGWMRKLAVWLGLASYALYMVHLPIQYLAEYLIARWQGHGWEADAPHYAWLVGLPVSLALAHVCTFRLDMPIRGIMNRLLGRRDIPRTTVDAAVT